MFPPTKSRFRSAALRSLDFAVEFATLGEYRLPEPPRAARPAPRRPRGSRPLRPPRPTIAIARRATRLGPATAAARRHDAPSAAPVVADGRDAVPAAPVAVGEALRTMALSGRGPLPTRTPRARAGQAQSAPQPCVTAEAS